jgi:hypothetical protein
LKLKSKLKEIVDGLTQELHDAGDDERFWNLTTAWNLPTEPELLNNNNYDSP